MACTYRSTATEVHSPRGQTLLLMAHARHYTHMCGDTAHELIRTELSTKRSSRNSLTPSRKRSGQTTTAHAPRATTRDTLQSQSGYSHTPRWSVWFGCGVTLLFGRYCTEWRSSLNHSKRCGLRTASVWSSYVRRTVRAARSVGIIHQPIIHSVPATSP